MLILGYSRYEYDGKILYNGVDVVGSSYQQGALNITFKITEVGRLSILFDV